MDECEVELRIFSPRWGHDDTYKVTLTRESMTVTLMPRSATCVWRENRDPEWVGESLETILKNDMIYPPSILSRLFEYVWRSWRNGDIDNAGVARELPALAAWLNEITRTKPDSEFWRRYF
jgi:hypothetical protein